MKKTMIFGVGMLSCLILGVLFFSPRVWAQKSFSRIGNTKTVTQMVPVSQAEVKLPLPEGGIRFRGRHTLFLNAKEGDQIKEKITSLQLGKYKHILNYILLDPSGDKIKAGRVPLKETGSIVEPAPKTGTYQLTVSTGSNAGYIEVDNRYYVVKTPVHVIRTRLKGYFYVPGGVGKFTVKIKGEGKGEFAGINIYDNMGNYIIKGDTTQGEGNKADIEVTVPEGSSGSIWSFKMYAPPTYSYEDAYFDGFSSKIPPYISIHQERMMKPAEEGK